ncbi:hypothetical protein OG897_24760 [Streptomyces sp. NBC_00237]|uniref:hypothetical protein n=1 Tax=Streptomyces sp. NBC_00237 TaxID=2975687 RepID=UPI002258654D|nr:hypothetical protein [Streptomyces sp. NBC_00237]MCX5204654.1 hypothetical protein [Streptomyces sp. NBC_00237]
MSLLRRVYGTALPLLPVLGMAVLIQTAWQLGPDALWGKVLVSLGLFGAAWLFVWLRWGGPGPPMDLEEVTLRFRRENSATGEWVRLVIPVRTRGLPGGIHYLGFTDRTVTAFTYDATTDTVTRLWRAERKTVALRGRRVVVAEGEPSERRVLIPLGLRGDVEYWDHTSRCRRRT